MINPRRTRRCNSLVVCRSTTMDEEMNVAGEEAEGDDDDDERMQARKPSQRKARLLSSKPLRKRWGLLAECAAPHLAVGAISAVDFCLCRPAHFSKVNPIPKYFHGFCRNEPPKNSTEFRGPPARSSAHSLRAILPFLPRAYQHNMKRRVIINLRQVSVKIQRCFFSCDHGEKPAGRKARRGIYQQQQQRQPATHAVTFFRLLPRPCCTLCVEGTTTILYSCSKDIRNLLFFINKSLREIIIPRPRNPPIPSIHREREEKPAATC